MEIKIKATRYESNSVLIQGIAHENGRWEFLLNSFPLQIRKKIIKNSLYHQTNSANRFCFQKRLLLVQKVFFFRIFLSQKKVNYEMRKMKKEIFRLLNIEAEIIYNEI